MNSLRVKLEKNSYDLLIESDSMDRFGQKIAEVHPPCRAIVVTDDHVAPHYLERVIASMEAAGFSMCSLQMTPGEATKSLSVLPTFYDAFIEAHLSRTDLIIALGGGVIGDVTGFAASSFLRGIPFIQIPTSLLAQVDSSVGGKVAVDLPQGKNLVGAFYQPERVLIDPMVLRTLPSRFYADGMAEVLKYGCIFDRHFFNQLEQKSITEEYMIYRCCELKASVVEKDERDRGERMLLNFGHTIGHAIEKAYHYETYTHGEAVAIGMVTITELSEQKGLTKPGTAKEIAGALRMYHLPTELPRIDRDEILEAISRDKKNLRGKLHVVLLKEIGKAFTEEVDEAFFEGIVGS